MFQGARSDNKRADGDHSRPGGDLGEAEEGFARRLSGDPLRRRAGRVVDSDRADARRPVPVERTVRVRLLRFV